MIANRLARVLVTAVTASASAALVGTAMVSPAGAAPAAQPSCRGTVSTNTVMTSDLRCTADDSGISLADGVTLDCAGHQVLGKPNHQGEGPGITVHSRSTVVNCIVKFFDAGIYLREGGSDNTITTNALTDNITDGRPVFGDGIVISKSSANQVLDNTVRHNGPFDGIGLVGKSEDNLIQGNKVLDNDIASTNFLGHPTVNQDDGIRIEGPGAVNNTVGKNTVTGSGLEGIVVFGNQGTNHNNTGNTVFRNYVSGNGFNTLNHQGSGIRTHLAADMTKIRDNTTVDNAADGIEIDSVKNVITGNFATGNSAAGNPPPMSPKAFDLLDTNPGCDANAWHANTYNTAKPQCAGAA